jgi:spermidine synthase
VALLLALATYASLAMKAVKALLALVPLAFLASEAFGPAGSGRLIYEKDSQYYNIRVVERAEYGIRRRLLLLDGSMQGAKFVGPAEGGSSRYDGKPDFLVFPYIQLSARLIDAFKPSPARALAVGGGAYSIPEYIQARYPASEVTVAEIDPAVTDAAKRFFLGPSAGSIRTVEADGRVFLQRSAAQYDLIYTDAYNGAFSVPWHLASREALAAMRDALRDDGILIMNVASSPEGPASALFRALWRTCDGLFPQAAILATKKDSLGEPQNLILLASKSKRPAFEEELAPFEPFRYRRAVYTADVPMLTDEFSPTDSLIEPLVMAYYPTLQANFE